MIQQSQWDTSREVTASRRAAHRPSLSVILLSHGDRSDLERALAAIAGRCLRMEAEIIVVRANLREDEAALGRGYPCVRFLDAARNSTSAEMREIGMIAASGDIIALRMDGSVGDGMWLEAFDATVGSVDEEMDGKDVRAFEAEIPLVPAVEEAAASSDERRKSRMYQAPSTTARDKRRESSARAGRGIELESVAPSVAQEM